LFACLLKKNYLIHPQVKLGDIVEIFLIDEGRDYDVSHPMHLHGHSFYVVAMERHGQNNSNVALASGTEGKIILKEDRYQ
jgi:FtsP/CotA-like multicopper oxidase with cupredoxin domain